MAEKLYLDENEISFDKLDFKWAIIRHIDRIGAMTSITQTEKQASVDEREKLLNLSIKILEMMLHPYQDEKYIEQVAEYKSFQKEGKEMAFSLGKFGCLMRLLHRKGFLMVGYQRGYGGSRDVEFYENKKANEDAKKAKEKAEKETAAQTVTTTDTTALPNAE